MISKNMKKAASLALSMAVVTSAVAPVTASAAGTRTKPEAYGDDTYKNRFLSYYDDVITNGQENGYLSKDNVASGGFGLPYHSVETMIVEAPDYGHETTSEAMSYIVWMAAMKDNLDGSSSDLAKAWKTMEMMIPTQQAGFWGNTPSATYSPELDTIEEYATMTAAMQQGNSATNPIHKYFTSAYASDKGLYLMHWLADVDNWYGFGSGNSFTLINTFQRGSMESCWETVPHPCVEELKYGNPQQGIKGVFKAPNETSVPQQWSYTNAPDAEDRAIQGVFAANRWGVGDSSVTALAAKMGDQLRNNMFDKYYKPIAEDTTETTSQGWGYEGAHYLRNWYTSWGGALDGSWTWQIGCSHAHEFYQNPLAAYALLADPDLKAGMKAENAVKDYETSLARQLEFYLWLQAENGPIAGGATNSNRGRYAPYSEGLLTEDGGTQNVSATFNGMLYVEHPVYLDPGSNHWIGNQVWALQRLAELYYYVKTDGDKANVTVAGMSIEEALEKILDKWVEWAVNDAIKLNDDGTYEIAASLNWSGEPDTWTGTATDNSGLSAEIVAWGSADMGCVASFANTLIHYAAAKGVDGVAAADGSDTSVAGQAFYKAKELLDRQWNLYRDDIGISKPDKNPNFKRLFEQEVIIPDYYTGTMPNGDKIEKGATFLSLRTKYKEDPMFATLEADYNDNKETDTTEFTYHRFWHAGDVLMALGYMAELFPDVTPSGVVPPTPEDTTTEATETTPADTSDSSEGTTTAKDTEETKDTSITGGDVDDILWGDTNVDGIVDIRDVTTLNQYIIKAIDLTPQGMLNADVINDGTVDISDLGQIKKYIVKLISTLDPAQNN